jgi:hypothetical protein
VALSSPASVALHQREKRRKETYIPHSAVFCENVGEKPFYVAELEISPALQIRSLSDIMKNANANCGIWAISS